MNGTEAGEVYDLVSHLSRQLRVAKAELALYKEKYEEALTHLKQHDAAMAHAIDYSDRAVKTS